MGIDIGIICGILVVYGDCVVFGIEFWVKYGVVSRSVASQMLLGVCVFGHFYQFCHFCLICVYCA
jgi:hypothetical protein